MKQRNGESFIIMHHTHTGRCQRPFHFTSAKAANILLLRASIPMLMYLSSRFLPSLYDSSMCMNKWHKTLKCLQAFEQCFVEDIYLRNVLLFLGEMRQPFQYGCNNADFTFVYIIVFQNKYTIKI